MILSSADWITKLNPVSGMEAHVCIPTQTTEEAHSTATLFIAVTGGSPELPKFFLKGQNCPKQHHLLPEQQPVKESKVRRKVQAIPDQPQNEEVPASVG